VKRAALAPLLAAATFAAGTARAAPSVWAVDDGEKIKRDATSLGFERGEDNPVWAPGLPVRLFALRNETVAFQVVVEADDAELDGVSVDLDALAGPGGAVLANAPGAEDPTRFVGRPIERFVEHYLDVTRASGGRVAGESIGWLDGAAPKAGAWTGAVPDALIPVEVAPAWSPYPLRIAPRTNGVVWIDVTVPRDQPPGVYTGSVVVRAGSAPLATLPVELEIEDAVLPDRILRTMLYYDRSELDRRIGGGDAAERHLWQLLHRHRLTALHDAKDVADVQRQLAALDGTAFTAAAGYEGPAAGAGDGVLSIGAYGALGAPSEAGVAAVERIADELTSRRVLETTDVFLYAKDEDCQSPWAKQWKALLAKETRPNAKRVRLAWTCDDHAAGQPVDVPIQLETFDPAETAHARGAGKEVWVYNGVRPMDGAFLTDTEAVSPRVNGWIGAMNDIGRWFFWETTFWYDDNRGGHGAYDPFVTAETFHNASGDWCEGDGVLLYPGKQVDRFTEHSIGMAGVVASIRLKEWRRGIEDAGYYQLARAADRAAADAIAARLVPAAMSAARRGQAPSWPSRGKPFFEARRALLALVPRGPDGGAVLPVGPDSPGPASRAGCGCAKACGASAGAGAGASAGAGAGASVGALVIALALTRRRRSRRAGASRRRAGARVERP
jgi:hypothetical protein